MKINPKSCSVTDDLMAGCCTNNGLTNENQSLDDWPVVGRHWPVHSSHRSEDGAVIMLGGGNYPHGQMGPPGCGRAD